MNLRARRGANRFRPRVETLEGRDLPSLYAPFAITSSTNDNVAPVTASSRNGMSVIAWEQDVNGQGDIYARLFDPKGHQVGSDIPVATSSDPEFRPDVAMDANGNFAVVWNHDDQGLGLFFFVHFALFNSSGRLVKNGDVATSTNGAQLGASVGMSAKGQFVVSYMYATVDPFSGSLQDVNVLAQRYDNHGNPQGKLIGVAAQPNLYEGLPSVDCNASGSFAIAYATNVPNTLTATIQLKRYTASGALLGSTKIATDTLASQPQSLTDLEDLKPDVTMDNRGNCTVLFTHGLTTGNDDILMRRVSAAGVVSSVRSLTTDTDYETAPAIALDSTTGNFVVAYYRVDSNNVGHAMVEEFTSAGKLLGQYDLGAGTSDVAVSMDGFGFYQVTYESPYAAGSHDVFANYGGQV
jgi:hypothetical protein